MLRPIVILLAITCALILCASALVVADEAGQNVTECANCYCLPTDFVTAGHDASRTGHSGTPLSDAWCDLSLKWSYHSPNVTAAVPSGSVDRIGRTTPIVFNQYVVAGFGNSYRIFDLATGAVLKTISGSGAPYFIANGEIESTPTIADVHVGGLTRPVLFLAGGSTEAITAIDLSSPLLDTLWTLHPGNCTAKGYPGSIGATTYTNIIFDGYGTQDLVCFTTSSGAVYMAYAATGERYWGPTILDGPSYGSIATDGLLIYVTTAAVPPGNPEGDIYALNRGNGTVFWKLSTAGGLKGNSTVYPGKFAGESFVSGICAHGGDLFAVSTKAAPNSTSAYPADGVYYWINSYDGSVLSAKPSLHVSNATGVERQASPLLEEALVLVGGGSIWPTPPLGRNLAAYNRYTGNLYYLAEGGTTPTRNACRADGLVTCENAGQSGTAVYFDDHGYLSFFKSQNGQELFSRRIDYTGADGFGSINNRGAGVALSKSGDLIVATYLGGLYCLTKRANRPRLEVLDFKPTETTYGNNPSAMLTYENVFTNTGCATLSGVLHFSSVSNGSLPGLSQRGEARVVDAAAVIADGLTSGSDKLARIPIDWASAIMEQSTAGTGTSGAAASVPLWFQSPADIPFTLPANDTADIVIAIDQSVLPRGPQKLYVTFESNDPDYFLNDVTARPEITVIVNGDCGVDSTHLRFGASATNLQAVTNTGRLGTGNWRPGDGGPGNFVVDGNATMLYQGTYVFGVSDKRIALNTQDWWYGGGEEEAWHSMLGDLNLYGECKPWLNAGVTLGSITNDGLTYVPLTGNMVLRSYVDSVQMFDASGTWNWFDYANAYFDPDSSMGLSVDSRVLATVDAPPEFTALNNVTVDMIRVFPRYGQSVNGFKFGAAIDYDVSFEDTTAIDRDMSTVWVYNWYNPVQGDVLGMIKIPFGGCSEYPPMKNAYAMNRYIGSVGVAGGPPGFVDSAYHWMSAPPGGYCIGPLRMSDDQNTFATLIEHDFTGHDTLSFAIAHFGFLNIDNPPNGENYRALAKLLNKWMGFDRGDVNNDGLVNLADIIYLVDYVSGTVSAPGPIPFVHMGDVDSDGSITHADVIYLINYYFHYGPCPKGKLMEF